MGPNSTYCAKPPEGERGNTRFCGEEPDQVRCVCGPLQLLDELNGALDDLYSNRLHRVGGAVAEFGLELGVAARILRRAGRTRRFQ